MKRDWPEPRPERTVIDPERLERILVQAAREGRPVSYRQVLDMFGQRLGSGTVGHLCRVLGVVDRARAEHGLPELACLVVRASDGQPGAGYFAAGDPQDPDARAALVARRQEQAFAWAGSL
ncbi:ribose-phosphate pyrophosphokinase [Geminicoccus flavidas]|uniref:ribose-phosphate pyrophosphokinase n=1 Tax=Geminicoccus flavidas TaxID=2506407 RepID=UPI0013594F5A|nr:ribose-phosphate pyrophosphokinase [Geminicoccus flavidas]